MDKVLLIIHHQELRQLYHELLIAINIEVVPVENVSNAILLLTLEHFTASILYLDIDSPEMEVFLNLRKNHKAWLRTKLILLTNEESSYHNYISEKDLLLNISKLSPEEVIIKIKQCIRTPSGN